MIRSLRRALALTAAAIALVAIPGSASAATYYFSAVPTGNTGNGFAWSQTGGWNPYGGGGRCETSATTYGQGSYCALHWTAPANTNPGGGNMSGTYRHANANFSQNMYVSGLGTTTIEGTNTIQGWNRQWSDMADTMYIQVINTGGATNTSAGTVFFQADVLNVAIDDPHVPYANILEGQGGWKGVGGTAIRYGFADAGSGLTSTAVTRLSDGQVADAPNYNNGGGYSTTGVFQNDRTIGLAAPGTGTWTYRLGATDKPGNYGYLDFNVSFDTTVPTVSAPKFGGVDVTNGREFKGSLGQYQPTFTFTSADAHSGMTGGLASTKILLDGNLVSNSTTYTPAAKLAPGTHTITVTGTDQVGNAASQSRTFTIVDDVAPTFTVAQPGNAGGNTPALDITAADDHSGVLPATYTVKVNGATLIATTNVNRLQAAIGRLVDGTHAIVVTVNDASGNTGTRNITYTADSGDAIPAPTAEQCPEMTCTYVHAGPTPSTEIEQGETVTIGATFAKAGRPVTGTATVKRDGGTIGTATINENGIVELNVTVAGPGPLTIVAPAGSGLADLELPYTYVSDIVAPTFAVASPGSAGGNSPVLDVTATDNRNGIDTTSWSVSVDGAPVVATSNNSRLQVNLGYVVDGTHTIVVKVKDGVGNEGTEVITYAADSGDDVPNPPAGTCADNTCAFVFNAPNASTIINHGTTIRIGALFMKNGRPVEGRVEIRSGNITLAGKDTGVNGVVDMSVLIDRPGPLTLVAPEGSGIADIVIEYSYVAPPPINACSVTPNAPNCKPGANGANGGGAAGGPGSANAVPAGCTTTSYSTCPKGVVYYLTVNGSLQPFWNGVPLGESGSKFDKIAPTWKLTLVQQKKGSVRKSRKIKVKVWSSEAGFVRVTPTGSRVSSLVSARRKMRVATVVIAPKSALGKKLAKAKPGSVVTIKLKVIAGDLNNNSSKAKTVTFKVRV